jgi:hypothetical protein
MGFRRAALCLFLVACGGHGDDGSGLPDFASIEVDPAFTTVTVPLGGTADQAYKVFGVDSSGDKTEITTQCSLSIDPDFGSFNAAVATVVPRGGKANITAACEDRTGAAVLAINLTGNVVVPPAPADAPDKFNGATTGTDTARIPAIEYPFDHAVSPKNMPPIEAQWTAAGNDLFKVTLTSTFLSVNVYTTSREAMFSEADWNNILASTTGDSIAISVEGLAQAAPTEKFTSTPVSIAVSKDTIDKTSIYYWASSKSKIMEQAFGATTQSEVKGGCTSCHTVNRNGTRIGYSRCVGGQCSQLYAGFLKYNATTQTWDETVNADNMAIHGSYTAFPTDGVGPFTTDSTAAIVSMVNGTLQLYNPDTAEVIPSNVTAAAATGPTATRSALMADWSPDGKKVVFASTPNANQWIDLSGGSIAIMDYEYQAGQHVFSPATFPFPSTVTLANGIYNNFFFPSFSPDNQLIVMNASRSAWRSNPARAAGQRLMLAAADASWMVDLEAMNGGMADLDTTWAHWAPTVGSDYYWVVFSSERDYGHRITQSNTAPACVANGVLQCKQIWIGAVARNKLTGVVTVDPSFPPMWLPGQDMEADNISPYWSVPAGLQ